MTTRPRKRARGVARIERQTQPRPFAL